MIFDRQYMKDIRAILDKASVLKVEPLQSVVKVVETPGAFENNQTNSNGPRR